MRSRLDETTNEVKRELAALYGPRLNAVFVFGSYARGEADYESDLDVLVVLDRVDHYFGELERSGGVIADLSLEYGVSISPVFVSVLDWLHGASAFLANVREEAISA